MAERTTSSLLSRPLPRRAGRRATTSSTGRASVVDTARKSARGSSVLSLPSARVAGPPLTASDVFEVVADGDADMLVEIIGFSGATHLCELRSKKQEDYGRNLLHCAVTNGQLKSLQILLKHKVCDPNQVDSVYTRSTPMMEAVKTGRVDLVECLIQAGGRLDVQDVNGDTVLHWAAREVSAACLREVLQLARRNGATSPELKAVLQVKNNSGEDAADVGANDVARQSIRRLVSGEEEPGVSHRRSMVSRSRQSNSTEYARGSAQMRLSQSISSGTGCKSSQSRDSYAGLGQTTGGGGGGKLLPPAMGRHRPQSAVAGTHVCHNFSEGVAASMGVPTDVMSRTLVAERPAPETTGAPPRHWIGGNAPVGVGKGAVERKKAAMLPKVEGVTTDPAIAGAGSTAASTESLRGRASSSLFLMIASKGGSACSGIM